MDKTEFLTVSQLAKKIGLAEYTVRKLAREDKLPAYRLTGKYLFDFGEVTEAIKKCRV